MLRDRARGIGTDLLETLTAMFNPLPAIALLPLALIWFGLGTPSLIFVLVHSVLWPVALNTHSGFLARARTRCAWSGATTACAGLRYVAPILVPAAFPSILTGLKIGWAFAWRTLIAAELVSACRRAPAASAGSSTRTRTCSRSAAVFAGLLTVILIGLLVENVIFRKIEAATVRKWGMQNELGSIRRDLKAVHWPTHIPLRPS